jgi:hypothetical protein
MQQRAAALAMFNKLISESFTVLAATGAHFRAAAKFVDQHAPGIHCISPQRFAYNRPTHLAEISFAS